MRHEATRAERELEECGEVQIRIHGPATAEALVYLPGVHGDWTLIASFSRAISHSVRVVQITYPRSLDWSLADYARNIENALTKEGINTGWLLGESFGSQVVWEMLSTGRFQSKGVILAGGFARYPLPAMATLAARLAGRSSFKLLTALFRGYVAVSRARFRHSPETLGCLKDFLARRTVRDCMAVRHRLELVARNDPRDSARQTKVPVYALSGFWDPIVPWYPAGRWLRRNCPTYQTRRVIWKADHNVLGTAPMAAAAQVLEWMARRPESDPGKRSG